MGAVLEEAQHVDTSVRTELSDLETPVPGEAVNPEQRMTGRGVCVLVKYASRSWRTWRVTLLLAKPLSLTENFHSSVILLLGKSDRCLRPFPHITF